MEIIDGKTRRVFLYKKLVIKVAKIDFYNFVRHLFNFFKKQFFLLKKIGFKNYLNHLRKLEKENEIKKAKIEKILMQKSEEMQMMYLGEPKFRIFDFLTFGIKPNIQEYKFYKKTKNIFAIPTYFSLFGLINIQKRGQEINFWDSKDVWDYINLNSQNEHQPWCDHHTLSEIANFCINENNQLQIVDYGNKALEPFLILNGEKLFKNFKIPGN